MRLYLDSNVLISFLKSEIDKSFNLNYLDAAKFFAACASLKAEIILSELFLDELKAIIFFEKRNVIESLNEFGIKYLFVPNAEESAAIMLSKEKGLHFSDSVHAATAKKENCAAIITWNKRDFEKVSEIIPCFSPREFLNNSL